MAKKKNSQINMLDHSIAKVDLLSKYINNYLNVILNLDYISTIQFYDLFCGVGLYPNGGKGSPLLILDEIIKIIHRKGNKEIACHFNDIDIVSVGKLNTALRHKYTDINRLITIRQKNLSYEDFLPQIILDTKRHTSKNFIFIDPYGYQLLRISDIQDLLQSNNNEVLLWLPLDQIYRHKFNSKTDKINPFVEQVISRKELVDHYSDKPDKWKFSELLKKGFQKAVGDDYYVDNFRIQKSKATLYCMYFFTSHIKGFEKMLEAKWSIDSEHGKGWHFEQTTQQPTLFNSNPTIVDKFWSNHWQSELNSFLSYKSRYNSELYEFTIRNGYLPKHTNEVLKKWEKSGRISVSLATGNKARKSSFYITYKNYKDYPNKSKIKLNRK